MRIRNAVLAGATAVAVAISGTAVASAEGDKTSSLNASSVVANDAQGTGEAGNTDLSSKIADSLELEKDKAANGQALFGSSHETDNGETWSAQPRWAKAMYITTIVAGLVSVLGLLVGPALGVIANANR